MKHYAITFYATPGCTVLSCNGQTACTLSLQEQMTITLPYSTHEQPLTLHATPQDGEAVQLIVRPYRLELWVNGALVDEEWPWGENMLSTACTAEGDFPVSLEEISAQTQTEQMPAVLGSFTGAEGWYPGNGVFVGDCMPYTHDGRCHVLYLKDRHHHSSKWGLGAHQWAHISSSDLIHWDIHPLAVEIDDPAEGSICTGSWILSGDIHHLYYTIRTVDGSPASICRSISRDGWHFHKDRAFRFTLSDVYRGGSARDPKVIRGEDGLLHMLITTTHIASGKGCLAHLTSPDGEQWSECAPIYFSPDANEPECPDYFYLNGWYYLVFSHYGQGKYLLSDRPFDGWRTPVNPDIPCHSVPKACIWNGRILFVGFAGRGDYGGSMTFLEAFPEKNGELHYEPVQEMFITDKLKKCNCSAPLMMGF